MPHPELHESLQTSLHVSEQVKEQLKEHSPEHEEHCIWHDDPHSFSQELVQLEEQPEGLLPEEL